MPFDLDAIPTPDLGLLCEKCGYPLGGLMSRRCPECGTSFEYHYYIPDGDFPMLYADGKEVFLTPVVEDALRRLKIPFIEEQSPVDQLYGLHGVMRHKSRVRVGRAHYLEAIDTIRRLKVGVDELPPLDASEDWTCTQCEEQNPGMFEICWQCETDRPADREKPV